MKKLIFLVILAAVLQYLQATAGQASALPPMPGRHSEPAAAADTAAAYAVVAGGSRGIGFAIAESLAKRQYNLLLIARGMGDLVAAKSYLERKYGVRVTILSYDLSREASSDSIAKWCIARHIRLKMLCNVAGYGGAQDYLSLPEDSLRYMVKLNVGSCMSLSLKLLPLLEKHAPSSILNVASVAGFAPIPDKNLYAATKSAVIFFSYSLRYQLREKGISVSVLCPGPVYTKRQIVVETRKQLGWFGDLMEVPPATVGEVAVQKTLKKRMVIVPGTLAYASSVLLRMMPRQWAAALYSKLGG